ncbi:MAG: secretion protein HlyD family protein [Chthoniobacteraceae bacterium]|nr:secretion protein HlyD family protein [Chthoniobacteraceae bacterium]
MKYDAYNTMKSGTSGRVIAPLISRTNEAANPPSLPTTAPSPKGWRKKLLFTAIGAAILFVAGSRLLEWWQTGRFMEKTDDAFIGGETTMIASRVPGLIVRLAVGDNQRVHAGDLLVQLDDRDYRARLLKAEAAVAAQDAALVNLDATTEFQSAMIDQARAQTDATAAEKSRAIADAARSRHLVKTRVVSEQDFQQFDAVAVKAAASDQAAAAGLVAAQRQLAVIVTQKQQVAAALAQARAELELARLNLEFTEIRSPIDGVVGNRHARVGAYAAIGSQLLSVVPTSGLWVEANFKESQLARMRPGQRVLVNTDMLAGIELEGRVESLAPATGAEFSLLPPENATGNFTKIVQRVPVRIRLEGDPMQLAKLRPGLSVVARVDQR